MTEFEIAGIRVRLDPTGASKATPQRTESLARELVRGLLGTAAPSFELVKGPAAEPIAGIKRELPPPEVTWIVGRGDDADWVILDEDLSREHVEIQRRWDGVTIRDLGSKNGTRVDGKKITGTIALHDGARIEIGNCELVFRDPAEQHLQGGKVEEKPEKPVQEPPERVVEPAGSRTTFAIATATCALSVAALLWLLAS